MTASTMICPLLPAVPGNERAIWSWKLGYERSLENRSYFVRCVGTRRLWPETPGLTKDLQRRVLLNLVRHIFLLEQAA